MSVYEDTMYILKKYNINANKSLGQNFLIDESVVSGIINSANVSKDDLIIEIGPGLGTLTKDLLKKAKKVIAIELDDRMIKILEDRFKSYDNFQLINDDVLKVDLKKLIEKEKSQNVKNVKIVANLPYYITTPIIMKLLEEKLDIKSITVMIQKEVAERIIETPGGKMTGAITYSVYYYAESESNLLVPNTSFIPEPEVASQVITLKIRPKPLLNDIDEKKLFKLIKVSFMQRRKTLVNALSNSGLIEKNEIVRILNELNIDVRIRGEKLTIYDFAKISNKIVSC
ncbi:MAG: 16S rRNA (adenine(1518)-N(6)/adenine(1519)-N(6))-dimethyltransferase RsmA [Clostridia bacterium]|nr:16S rRNA (adenine(1518)-N(6)/adenine(1519)-N(6))-dimethyltransferase RsmA [Clostridia bacterium]